MTITGETTYGLRSFRRIQLAVFRERVMSFRIFGVLFAVAGALTVSPAGWTIFVVGYGLFLVVYSDAYVLFDWRRFRRHAGALVRYEFSTEGVKFVDATTEYFVAWSGCTRRKVSREGWLLTVGSTGRKLGIPRSAVAEDEQDGVDWLVRDITPVHVHEATSP